MKHTEAESKLFKEIQQKHNLKNEGFFMNFFKKRLKNKLENDVDLLKALIDADKELDRVARWAKSQEEKGIDVPDYLKRYLPR
jgi:S-methylmethionine-dependent homocysteine/selenocysteine methylase